MKRRNMLKAASTGAVGSIALVGSASADDARSQVDCPGSDYCFDIECECTDETWYGCIDWECECVPTCAPGCPCPA